MNEKDIYLISSTYLQSCLIRVNGFSYIECTIASTVKYTGNVYSIGYICCFKQGCIFQKLKSTDLHNTSDSLIAFSLHIYYNNIYNKSGIFIYCEKALIVHSAGIPAAEVPLITKHLARGRYEKA